MYWRNGLVTHLGGNLGGSSGSGDLLLVGRLLLLARLLGLAGLDGGRGRGLDGLLALARGLASLLQISGKFSLYSTNMTRRRDRAKTKRERHGINDRLVDESTTGCLRLTFPLPTGSSATEGFFSFFSFLSTLGAATLAAALSADLDDDLAILSSCSFVLLCFGGFCREGKRRGEMRRGSID